MSRWKRSFKSLLFKIIYPILAKYLASERRYRYRDVEVRVPPGVFHPGLFFSTRILLDYLETLPVAGKRVLELGAGSGLIALRCARRGASVTASDISTTAVEAIRANARRNGRELTVIHSDLFAAIPRQAFDLIVINPPYFPRTPLRESQYAWFCGENFEFYRRLFPEMRGYLHRNSRVLMILSEDCRIDHILSLARENGYEVREVHRRRNWWETNFVFQYTLVQDEKPRSLLV